MYQTKAARSLKTLFAKYHEPPQLSNQESQKILDGLKSSFRDQLDREYGVGPQSSSTSSQNPSHHHEGPKRHPAAQRHLKHLLSNPLFSYQQFQKADTAISAHPSSSLMPPQEQLATARREPLDVFDHAVSRGLMTLKAATGILIAKRKQHQSGQDTLEKEGAARRVVRWLRSSRSQNDLAFLDDRPFMGELMPFLVREGLDEVAWEWISRLLSPAHDSSTFNHRSRSASHLLSELVRLKSLPQDKDLDAAMMTLVQARDRFRRSPVLPHLLLPPWQKLSWLATVSSYTHTKPSLKAFDAHMETSTRLSSPVEVEKAHLSLYHPAQADPSPALRLLKDRVALERLASSSHTLDKGREQGEPSWLAELGNDTVNYLAWSGRKDEAQELMVILQRHAIYPT